MQLAKSLWLTEHTRQYDDLVNSLSELDFFV